MRAQLLVSLVFFGIATANHHKLEQAARELEHDIVSLHSNVRQLEITADQVAAVKALAATVYTSHFSNVVIGDCDFGYAIPVDADVSTPELLQAAMVTASETRANELCGGRQMIPAIEENPGCTMAQMFLGNPITCKCTKVGQTLAYRDWWSGSFGGLAAMRVLKYNQAILEDDAQEKEVLIVKAGCPALKKAQTSMGCKGVGVCTTLAAAGLTKLAIEMSQVEALHGLAIAMVSEDYGGDGHEYLFVGKEDVTSLTTATGVLVDYWYSALNGAILAKDIGTAYTENDLFQATRPVTITKHRALKLVVHAGAHIEADVCD
jgi:hypothetical protein